MGSALGPYVGGFDLSGEASMPFDKMISRPSASRARRPLAASASLAVLCLCLSAGRAGAQDLTVTGAAQIAQGVTQAYDNTFIGISGVSGSLTVTDPATRLTNSDTVVVGASGAGDLAVLAGASVVGASGMLGQAATGQARISGAGSAWTTSGTLTVGSGADGTLRVEQGARLVSGEAILAAAGSSAVGTVEVSGAGASWLNSGNLQVGGFGSGALLISDGGVVTTGDTVVAGLLSPSGTVLVSGAGSALRVNGSLGLGTNGRLALTDGAHMTSLAANIGVGVSAGTGSVTLTDAGSRWDAAGIITVGALGAGSLVIATGAVVTSTGAVVGTTNSSGQLAVQGTGARFAISGDLSVAASGGIGFVALSDGGVLSNVNALVGNTFSPGEVAVGGAGARWDSTGTVQVQTAGVVSLFAGGVATSAELLVGFGLEDPARVRIADAGSVWTVSDAVAVGFGGYASLDITGGGVLRGGDGALGVYFGDIGLATVSGAGSLWHNAGVLYVGDGGDGALSIGDGGTVSADFAVIGYQPRSTGDVSIGSGATLAVTNELAVGFGGLGAIAVADGGVLTSGLGVVGAGPGSQGMVSVSGIGSRWTVAGELSIASAGGQGRLQVAAGGRVRAGLVDAMGGTADILVHGAGSLLDAGSGLLLGGLIPSRLTLTEGGTLTAAVVSVGTPTAAGNAGLSAVIVIGADAGARAVAPGALDIGALTVNDGATAQLVLNHTDGAYQVSAALSGALAIHVSSGTTTLAGSNSYGGGTQILGGTLIGSAASFGSGAILNQASLVLDQTGTGTLSADLSGSGTVVKTGAGTLIYAGNGAAFSGATTVAAGTLTLAGSLGGAVAVSGGARLAGSGSVGALALATGSTIAPGSSVGTVTVAGAYSQAAGATYAAEVSAGRADLITVGGTATLAEGALLSISGLGGLTPLGTRLTVLTAAGGVTGDFTLVGAPAISAFYAVEAVADRTGVYLDVMQDRPFAAAAVTPNQRATAIALDSLPTGSLLHDAVGAQMTDGAARAAFSQLAGDLYPGLQTALLEDSRFVRDAVVGRLRAAFGGVAAPSGAVASLPSLGQGPAIWGRAYGAWGTFDGTANATGFDRTIGGFLAGADGPVGVGPSGEVWRLGGFAGFGQSSYASSPGGGSADSDDLHAGLYAGGAFGALALRMGAAYTHQDFDTSRTIAFPSFFDRLSGAYDAHTAQVFGDLGWRMTLGPAALEPFVGLAYVHAASGALVETGGVAALSVDARAAGVTFTTLGVRAAHALLLGPWQGQVSGSAGWRHAFGATDPSATLGFAGSTPFTVSGVPLAEESLVLEGGLALQLSPAAQLSVAYGGAFGAELSDNGLTLGLNWRF